MRYDYEFLSGTLISDKKKLMMFVERYLELSSELAHKKGETGAHMQLGLLEKQEGEYGKSVEHFRQARQLARENDDPESAQEASVNCGIASAQLKWNDAMNGILEKIKADEAAGQQ